MHEKRKKTEAEILAEQEEAADWFVQRALDRISRRPVEPPSKPYDPHRW